MTEYEYVTKLPTGYAVNPDVRYPLVVFLHGSGERGFDTSIVLQAGSPWDYLESHPDLPCVFIAPQCPPDEYWKTVEMIALLDEIEAKCRIDRDRIYVTGLSLGGFGAWTTAVACPERLAAIAPVCGGGDPKSAAALRGLPTWVFHGAQDEDVPIGRSQAMVDAQRAAGGDVRFTVYPEDGHYIWGKVYSDPEFYAWLFAQRRQG